MPREGKVIIKITSPVPGESVVYSLDNGQTHSEFEDGGLYEVPLFALRGMMDPSRNWARPATADDIKEPPPSPEPPKESGKKKGK